MNPIPELVPYLKQLRLSGILDSLEARNRQALDGKLAYTEFLALLIEDEVARREHPERQLAVRGFAPSVATVQEGQRLEEVQHVPMSDGHPRAESSNVVDNAGLQRAEQNLPFEQRLDGQRSRGSAERPVASDDDRVRDRVRPGRGQVEEALAAVERGIPLLVEKPLATDLAESQRVLDAIEQA